MARIKKQIQIGYGGEASKYRITIGKKDLSPLHLSTDKTKKLQIQEVMCSVKGDNFKVTNIKKAKLIVKDKELGSLKDITLNSVKKSYRLPEKELPKDEFFRSQSQVGNLIQGKLDKACKMAINKKK